MTTTEVAPYKYQYLKDYLMGKIRSGEYAGGGRIESEPSLSERFGLSRNTVRQAVKEMENEGYFYRIQGKGTFVRDATPQSSRKIALLIYDTVYMTHPVTAELICGIDAGLSEHGYVLDILAGKRSFYEEKVSKLAEKYAGFLIGAYQIDEMILDELEKTSLPCLFVKNYLEKYRDQALRIDYEKAGFLAAEHLIKIGCSNLGMIYAGDGIAISRDFRSGVQKACLEYGARLKAGNIAVCDFNRPKDVAGVIDGFDHDFPDGIICSTDEFAMVLCEELKKRGSRQVAVTGCNNTPVSAHFSPSLTTIDIPTRELGYRAAALLISMIKGEANEISRLIEPALIIRDSTNKQHQGVRDEQPN